MNLREYQIHTPLESQRKREEIQKRVDLEKEIDLTLEDLFQNVDFLARVIESHRDDVRYLKTIDRITNRLCVIMGDISKIGDR